MPTSTAATTEAATSSDASASATSTAIIAGRAVPSAMPSAPPPRPIRTNPPAGDAHPSRWPALMLGEEVETGMGGGLDPSPTCDPTTTRAPAATLSVADLLHALRIATAARDGHRASAIVIPPTGSRGEPSTSWLAVLAAHSGAGASTTALAVATAAAELGSCDTHLVECAPACRSGLAGAAATELGVDATSLWRQGQRDRLLLHRRVSPPRASLDSDHAEESAAPVWPAIVAAASEPPSAARSRLVIVDASGTSRRIELAGAATVLVVFRATVPGARAAETLLTNLERDGRSGQTIVAAALGPRRWPQSVSFAAGARLSALRERGRLISVPTDRHLAVSGATSSPLPKPLLAAARTLLNTLLPVTRTDIVFDDSLPSDQAAGRRPQDGEPADDALTDSVLFEFATGQVR